MHNTNTIKYPIKRISFIDDQAVLEQLPINILSQLGEEVGSGFHLELHRRDIEFNHGLVQYVLGETTATVEFD